MVVGFQSFISATGRTTRSNSIETCDRSFRIAVFCATDLIGASEEGQATDLRLDDRASAIEFDVFDFENPAESELIARVTTADPDTKMPPPDSQKHSLSSAEVEILRTWIGAGANYEKHWSYQTPQRPEPPEVPDQADVFNAIDAFVVARVMRENRKPSAVSERSSLIRRVTFDLTCLPPSFAEIEAFENDKSPLRIAYGKVVDRLLSSEHYGEQMARFWLDSARYADTSGYQYDRERKQWVWRDWVINAFNTNMPFDNLRSSKLLEIYYRRRRIKHDWRLVLTAITPSRSRVEWWTKSIGLNMSLTES